MRMVKLCLPISVLMAGVACSTPPSKQHTFCTQLTVPNPGWHVAFSHAFQCEDSVLLQARLVNHGGIQPQVLTTRNLCVTVSLADDSPQIDRVVWQFSGKTWHWAAGSKEHTYVDTLATPEGCHQLTAHPEPLSQ